MNVGTAVLLLIAGFVFLVGGAASMESESPVAALVVSWIVNFLLVAALIAAHIDSITWVQR